MRSRRRGPGLCQTCIDLIGTMGLGSAHNRSKEILFFTVKGFAMDDERLKNSTRRQTWMADRPTDDVAKLKRGWPQADR